MKTEFVEKEIRRFLETEEPEVICILGKWGVGKTFAWKKYLGEAKGAECIKLEKYSYVSLFGLNTLDDLKYSIFENLVVAASIGAEPSLKTLLSNTSGVIGQFKQKVLWLFNDSKLKSYIGDLKPMYFASISKTIICIDDVERRGSNLTVRDVMGLISLLKEQKKCKVAIILNDDALSQDKADFDRYFEKVVDVSLLFAPSPIECCRIALDCKTDSERLFEDSCVALGICNIRVIKKLARLLSKLSGTLDQFKEQAILEQVVKTLVLLGWSIFEPTIAPPIDFIRKKSAALLKGESVVGDEETGKWNAQLEAYGWTHFDEPDLVLLEGIRDGAFDEQALLTRLTEIDARIKAEEQGSSFFKAWDLYHDSFDDNKEDVLKKLFDSFMTNAKYISLNNVDGTVRLFKELGRTDQATPMIQHYIQSHAGDPSNLDIELAPFGSDISDLELIAACKQIVDGLKGKETTNPVAILKQIAESNSWNDDAISTLSSLSAEEYFTIFKTVRDKELRKTINTCLQFGRIQNATPAMKEISLRAKAALTMIGNESDLNARRVRIYGIDANGKLPPSKQPDLV